MREMSIREVQLMIQFSETSGGTPFFQLLVVVLVADVELGGAGLSKGLGTRLYFCSTASPGFRITPSKC